MCEPGSLGGGNRGRRAHQSCAPNRAQKYTSRQKTQKVQSPTRGYATMSTLFGEKVGSKKAGASSPKDPDPICYPAPRKGGGGMT
jgi:hypothetical protein